MDLQTFKNIMNLLNYPENEWIRPRDLREVFLKNNMAQKLVYSNCKIKYDTKRELFLIKEVILKHQSSLLKKITFIDKTHFVISSGVINPYKSEYKLRLPAIGDYVRFLDFNGNDLNILLQINNITRLKNDSGLLFEVNESDIYDRVVNDKIKIVGYLILQDYYDNLIIPFEEQKYNWCYEQELSKREADIIIGISNIIGFESAVNPENNQTEF